MRVLCRRLPAALILLLGLQSGMAGAQTWYESYHQAEEALEAGEWGQAVRHLNDAVAQKPDSAMKARTYGMRFVDYFPYLKLGVAYYHLGQPDAALQAFETELGQGAIAAAASHNAELLDYRTRIDEERSAQEAARLERSRSVVTENMTEVLRAEADGEFDVALGAVVRVLAVEPDHGGALSAQGRLLEAVAALEREAGLRERVAALVERGRRELSAGDARHAAGSFAEAQQVLPSTEVGTLLTRAQNDLAAQLAETDGELARDRLVSESLARALGHERRGEWAEVLAEVQAVLAIEGGNAAALALQGKAIEQRTRVDESNRVAATVERLLTQSADLHAAGDYEGALRAANRVLTTQPSDPRALQQIASSYARLGDRLLTEDEAPPVIVFDAVAEAGESLVSVTSPDFVLSGRVFDGTPVEVVARVDGEEVPGVVIQRHELEGLWVSEFTVGVRLASGAAFFQVLAIDAEGNTTVAETTVEYVVPFLRSRWLPVSAAVLIALTVGSLGLARFRRRRRLLRGRFNPYVAGAPILEQERYVGRRQLLDYVLRRICNNSVMLYGERRIGKTSFQHQLKRCLTELEDPDHEFFPVFVDLQGIPEEKFFATLAMEVFHELGPKLNGLQPHVALAEGEYRYREFVQDTQRLLAALQERSRKKIKLVLLIDEVDELNHYDPRINQRLRSLFMRAFAERLVAVVSGVAIKKHWEREGSPWYNFFQEIEVKPLDHAEARTLIEAPVSGIFGFEEGAADVIIERTRSKPYLIQRLCSGLVDRMHEEKRQTITLDDVEAGCSAEGL